MLLLVSSVNQRLPSGPLAIMKGSVPAVGMGNSVMVPVGVIVPMLFTPASVNQRLPPGPLAMLWAVAPAVGMGNSLMVPVGVIRPMLFTPLSVNQRLPSGPLAMPTGELAAVGMGNSVMETPVVAPLTKRGVITSTLSKRLPKSTLLTSCARRLLLRARNKLLRWTISTLPSALSKHNMRPTGCNREDSVPSMCDRRGDTPAQEAQSALPI